MGPLVSVAPRAITTARHCTPSIDLALESGLVPAFAIGPDAFNPVAVIPITDYVNAAAAPGKEKGLLLDGGLHAYCFPSGTAFDRSRSVEFCRSLALHLGDLGRAQRAEGAFTALRPPHDARFLADLLSFIHFWSAERGEPAPPDIREALHRTAPEWGRSWSHNCVDTTLFGARAREWLARSGAQERGGPPPPYYVFPLLFEAAPRRELVHDVLLAAERWLANHLPSLPAFNGAQLPIARQCADAREVTPAPLPASPSR